VYIKVNQLNNQSSTHSNGWLFTCCNDFISNAGWIFKYQTSIDHHFSWFEICLSSVRPDLKKNWNWLDFAIRNGYVGAQNAGLVGEIGSINKLTNCNSCSGLCWEWFPHNATAKMNYASPDWKLIFQQVTLQSPAWYWWKTETSLGPSVNLNSTLPLDKLKLHSACRKTYTPLWLSVNLNSTLTVGKGKLKLHYVCRKTETPLWLSVNRISRISGFLPRIGKLLLVFNSMLESYRKLHSLTCFYNWPSNLNAGRLLEYFKIAGGVGVNSFILPPSSSSHSFVNQTQNWIFRLEFWTGKHAL